MHLDCHPVLLKEKFIQIISSQTQAGLTLYITVNPLKYYVEGKINCLYNQEFPISINRYLVSIQLYHFLIVAVSHFFSFFICPFFKLVC